jgi:hypothetical protein
MATSKAWAALSALVGAGAALLTTVTIGNVNRNDERTPPAQVAATSTHAQTDKAVLFRGSPGRLEAPDQALARLRDERDVPDGHDEHTPPQPASPDPEEERRRVEARFGELEQRLLAEPVDPAWSSEAMELLRKDLSAITRSGGFELAAVECRTTMCRATLRWDNYGAAVKAGLHLPELATPGLNCTTGIWLEEPSSPAESYSSNLFLDCSEQRAVNVTSSR